MRSSADYALPAAELAARRDLRGPEYLVCRCAGWGQGCAACGSDGCTMLALGRLWLLFRRPGL